MRWPKGPASWIEGRTLYVSVPFSWNLPKVRAHLSAPNLLWDRAMVGGPAVALMPNVFDGLDHVDVGGELPGILQRVNPLATRTTTGCIRSCGFCGIGRGLIEPGGFVELSDWPDLPVLIDNNLLAASQPHFDRVMDRLERWGWADFSQGLDSRLLTSYHAARFARLKDTRTRIRLALDSMAYADGWLAALETLVKAGVSKKLVYSYAIVGFRDTPEEAWRRCDLIKRAGVSVLAMRYHPLNAMQRNVVLAEQREAGWSDAEFKHLMGYYWRRRGAKPDFLEAA